MSDRVRKFENLLWRFTEGRIRAAVFEAKFLDLWYASEKRLEGESLHILHGVYCDLGDFCADPAIRDDDMLDERQLEARVRAALGELRRRAA